MKGNNGSKQEDKYICVCVKLLLSGSENPKEAEDEVVAQEEILVETIQLEPENNINNSEDGNSLTNGMIF